MSSAKLTKFNISHNLLRSFKYSINNDGPKIYAWGIPESTTLDDENVPINRNIRIAVGEISLQPVKNSPFYPNMLAFFQCYAVINGIIGLCKVVIDYHKTFCTYALSMNSRIAPYVLEFSQTPYWEFINKVRFLKLLFILLHINFSKMFVHTPRVEIGL